MAARVDVIDLPRRVIFVRDAAHWLRWQGHVMGVQFHSIPFGKADFHSQLKPIKSRIDNLSHLLGRGGLAEQVPQMYPWYGSPLEKVPRVYQGQLLGGPSFVETLPTNQRPHSCHRVFFNTHVLLHFHQS